MNLTTTSEEYVKIINKNFKIKLNLDIDNSFTEKVMLLFFKLIKKYDTFSTKYFNSNKKMEVKKINNINEIPIYGKNYDKFFPKEIHENIIAYSNYIIKYNLEIDEKSCCINFITEEHDINLIEYHKFIKYIIIWLKIANDYSTSNCGKKLNIYIYLTNFKKLIPKSQFQIIDCNNVNSGLSDGCETTSEIIIYRREEWFKVLIHEIFHNYGLDFSILNLNIYNKKLENIFPIPKNILLFESYCEIWANFINSAFVSYSFLDKKNDFNSFKKYMEVCLNFELKFTLIQMSKILLFMNLNYNDLYSKNPKSIEKRNIFYKEKTNVCAYFIIKTILFYNLEDFLMWCSENNVNILRFKKSEKSVNSLIDFIEERYKKKKFINLLSYFKNKLSEYGNNNKNHDFFQNLRLTLLELNI